MDKCIDFLQVLKRDMKEIRDDFKNDMEVMEKMKNIRLHVSNVAAAGAGIDNNFMSAMQDIAAMNKMISLCTNMMEEELSIRKGVRADKIATYKALCRNHLRRRGLTAKRIRGNDGKGYTVLVPTHKQLADRPSTPNDVYE